MCSNFFIFTFGAGAVGLTLLIGNNYEKLKLKITFANVVSRFSSYRIR